MKTSPINIILLQSPGKSNNLLIQALTENGYQLDTLTDIETAIERITRQSVDLLICENTVNEYSGFAVFKILMKYLRNYGIPFFLVLDSFEKEDMLIGLEIGIDNFIVHPLNKGSISHKIENQLRKKDELNFFQTGNFKDYFNSSLTAMFYVENNKICLVNQAFHKLHNGCTNKMLELPVNSVFNISDDHINELNYRRFQNGITNYCKLVEIQCFNNKGLNFDVSFYRGKNQGTTHVFAEIVENQHLKEISEFDDYNKSNIVLSESTYTENIKLTSREKQVFEMSANGLPIKIIAVELGLSERTVEKHRANIMAKANAKNMIEAIIHIQKSNNKTEFTKLNY